MSLSDYALRESIKVAERPTREELAELLHGRPTRQLSFSPADTIREERNARSFRSVDSLPSLTVERWPTGPVSAGV